MLCCAVLCCTILLYPILFCIVLFCAILFCFMFALLCAVLCCAMLCCAVLCFAELLFTVLFCAVLFCIVSAVLRCAVQRRPGRTRSCPARSLRGRCHVRGPSRQMYIYDVDYWKESFVGMFVEAVRLLLHDEPLEPWPLRSCTFFFFFFFWATFSLYITCFLASLSLPCTESQVWV